jgi:lipoyl-dependent peroxiredoxin
MPPRNSAPREDFADADVQLAPISRPAEWDYFSPMKTIHIAEMIAQGGRDGRVEAPDGGFAVELSTDERPESVTPEHLFAGAYAACFLGAVQNAAEKVHIKLEGETVVARAHLEEDDRGGYQLNVELRAALPGVSDSDAQHILNLAHQSCPYSKATRGNINVRLTFD